MNVMLLQGGLVSFMIGILLSLPLAAVHYDRSPRWASLFANPRKLKSAHLDFFMQAFAAGLAYLLERACGTAYPLFVAIPLLYGTIGNPLILLLEATAIFRAGFTAVVYRVLKATSPASLLAAWCMIAGRFLPIYALLFLILFALAWILAIRRYDGRQRQTGDTET